MGFSIGPVNCFPSLYHNSSQSAQFSRNTGEYRNTRPLHPLLNMRNLRLVEQTQQASGLITPTPFGQEPATFLCRTTSIISGNGSAGVVRCTAWATVLLTFLSPAVVSGSGPQVGQMLNKCGWTQRNHNSKIALFSSLSLPASSLNLFTPPPSTPFNTLHFPLIFFFYWEEAHLEMGTAHFAGPQL